MPRKAAAAERFVVGDKCDRTAGYRSPAITRTAFTRTALTRVPRIRMALSLRKLAPMSLMPRFRDKFRYISSILLTWLMRRSSFYYEIKSGIRILTLRIGLSDPHGKEER